MKISVITVCYNAEKFIKETMLSVLNQTVSCEYIIVDGLSKDKTVKIAEKIIKEYNNSFHKCKLISEKDSGIYDAMNKGTQIATGDYVIFMNAGDTFVNKTILEQIQNELNEDIVYGPCWRKELNLYHLSFPGKLELITEFNVICHQSVFIKKSLLIEQPYDISYKIVADYEFLLRQYLNGASFKKVDLPISVYLSGGISEKRYDLLLEESLRVISSYGFDGEYCKSERKKLKKEKLVSKVCPDFIKNIYNRRNMLKSGWSKTIKEY